MFKKFLRENKLILFASIFLLFIFFFLMLFSSNRIYIREKNLVLNNEDILLSNHSLTVKNYFSDISDDLNFLTSNPVTLNFINSSFNSVSAEQDFINLLSKFIISNKGYERITVLDNTGKEKLKLLYLYDKDKVVKDEQLKILDENLIKNYWQQINENRIFVSMIELDPNSKTSKKIETDMGSGLYNSKNEKVGLIITKINLDRVSQLLPKNMFIQTEEGNLILSQYDESNISEISNYAFNSTNGILNVSKSSGVHFIKIEYLPNKFLTVASIHDHESLINTLIILITTSSTFFIFLIILMLYWLFINFKRFKDLIEANKAIIFSLAQLAEFRDGGTGAHLNRTRKYTVILAQELSHNKKYRKIINHKFLEELDTASIMHDIGKVGTRDSILLKKSSLTPAEYEEIKKHVLIGSNIIENTLNEYKTLQSIFTVGKNIIKYHHEKFNGSGYPCGLKGEEIPLEARIFALVDAYDVIRSKRPYKDPLPHSIAIERILSDSNKHFDPEVVSAFMSCEKKFLEISLNM
jgi:putative two-component system response regulator